MKGLSAWYDERDARSSHPLSAFVRDRCTTHKAGRTAWRHLGIRVVAAPVVNLEPWPQACTKSWRERSSDRRVLYAVYPEDSAFSFFHCVEALYATESSP